MGGVVLALGFRNRVGVRVKRGGGGGFISFFPFLYNFDIDPSLHLKDIRHFNLVPLPMCRVSDASIFFFGGILVGLGEVFLSVGAI